MPWPVHRACYTGRVPRVGPFHALLYDVAAAGPLERVTAPPYDVISEPRRGGYLASSPYNIAHVDLAAHGSMVGEEDHAYVRAGRLLSDWVERGVLVRSPEPSYFAYEMRFEIAGAHRNLRGLLCAMELEPWGGAVLPHERTMPDPVEDRLRLLRATHTHLSPIYGVISGPLESLRRLLDDVCAGPAQLAVTDEEDVEHRMWSVTGTPDVARWLGAERLLIADGHHRYTTALAFRDERRARDGSGPWDRILTLVVDAGTQEVPVLPYHRLQVAGSPPAGGRDVAGLPELLEQVDDAALRYGTASRNGRDRVAFRTHQLAGEPPTVAALHRDVLDVVAPGDALRFTHDTDDAILAVRSGAAVAAYILPPTSPERIRTLVERGERLPRKSTFFWPKPRTGMVLMPLDRPA